jgi:hypothetical protein
MRVTSPPLSTKTISINFLTATPAQLRKAERQKSQLEDAGYVLVQNSLVAMTYQKSK